MQTSDAKKIGKKGNSSIKTSTLVTFLLQNDLFYPRAAGAHNPSQLLWANQAVSGKEKWGKGCYSLIVSEVREGVK